jgi:hypothetical protein
MLFLGAAPPVFAQTEDVAVTGGWSVFPNPSIGELTVLDADFNPFPVEARIANGVRIGVRLSFNRSHFSHEFNYAWQRSGVNLDTRAVAIHNIYYNAVLHATPADAQVRPFVTVGGGFSAFFNPGGSSLQGLGASEKKAGYNFGGGTKFRLTDRFGMRLDVRDHVTGKPFGPHLENVRGRLHNVEYSVGFALLDLW